MFKLSLCQCSNDYGHLQAKWNLTFPGWYIHIFVKDLFEIEIMKGEVTSFHGWAWPSTSERSLSWLGPRCLVLREGVGPALSLSTRRGPRDQLTRWAICLFQAQGHLSTPVNSFEVDKSQSWPWVCLYVKFSPNIALLCFPFLASQEMAKFDVQVSFGCP